MQSSRKARPSKKQLWFQAGRYYLRTIKREDASDRWGSWLADSWAVHVLNSASRRLQKSDIAEYIRQFDQRSQLLLGIFERGTRLHVGFIRIDLEEETNQAFVSAVVGDPAHRNRGATTEVFVPLLDFLFDKVGIERVKASILLRNQLTLRYLLKLGWQRDETPEAPVKSQVDGISLERCLVSWTREGYRAFRRSAIGSRILKRLSDTDQ